MIAQKALCEKVQKIVISKQYFLRICHRDIKQQNARLALSFRCKVVKLLSLIPINRRAHLKVSASYKIPPSVGPEENMQ